MNLIHDYLGKVDEIQSEVYSPSAMVDKVKGIKVNMKEKLGITFKNSPKFSCRTLWVSGYISCFCAGNPTCNSHDGGRLL
jgi:hypothetical protein